jgi:hypothetical protein
MKSLSDQIRSASTGGTANGCNDGHTAFYEALQMEREFVFRNSAFKHNLTGADIRHAFKTCCYVDQYKRRENVYLLLGFDLNANPVEILYNEFGENGVNVFHAMPCQKQFIHLY